MSGHIWRGRHPGIGRESLYQHLQSLTRSDRSTKLGEGSYGAVYRHVTPDGRTFAVKVLQRERNEFLPLDAVMELAIFKALSGAPHIAQLREAWYDDRNYYLFMDFQEASLHQLISRGQVDIRKHFSQMCTGLHIMHTQGILHNDIKPPNILVSPEGNVLFSDYGISRTVSCSNARDTARGRTTAVFSAPEEMVLEQVSRATDIYSLGITFACCVFGRVYPYSDAVEMLAELNGVTVGSAKMRVAAKLYADLPVGITLSALKVFFKRDIREDFDKGKIGASEANRQTHWVDHLTFSPDFERDMNSMLSTDPSLRPAADGLRTIPVLPDAAGFRRSDPPAHMDFARCYAEEISSGVAFLSKVLSNERAPGIMLGLTLDLASRLSQTCNALTGNFHQYLLLCFNIMSKIYYADYFSLKYYNEILAGFGLRDPGFDPVRAEIIALSSIDFNVFSCAEDAVRLAFSEETVEQAAAKYLASQPRSLGIPSPANLPDRAMSSSWDRSSPGTLSASPGTLSASPGTWSGSWNRSPPGTVSGGHWNRSPPGTVSGGPRNRSPPGTVSGGPRNRSPLGTVSGGPLSRSPLGTVSGGPLSRSPLGTASGGPRSRSPLGTASGGPLYALRKTPPYDAAYDE